jgi:hypothetical protein
VSEAEDIDLRVVMPSSRKVFAAAVLWLLCICTALVWSPVGPALAQEEEAPPPFLQQDDAPADTAEVPAPEQGAIEEPAAEEGGAPPPNAASQADPEVESTGEPTVGGEPAAGGEPAVDTSSDPADPLLSRRRRRARRNNGRAAWRLCSKI